MRLRWRIAVVAATLLPLCLIGIGLAQPPGMPQPPGIPRQPAGPRIPGGGGFPRAPGAPAAPNVPEPGQQPGFAKDYWEFRCSNCNAVIGTGYRATDEPQ